MNLMDLRFALITSMRHRKIPIPITDPEAARQVLVRYAESEAIGPPPVLDLSALTKIEGRTDLYGGFWTEAGPEAHIYFGGSPDSVSPRVTYDNLKRETEGALITIPTRVAEFTFRLMDVRKARLFESGRRFFYAMATMEGGKAVPVRLVLDMV